VKGTAERKGCPVPDRDADGVEDEQDACPDEPGTAELKGCKPKVELKADGIQLTEAVFFEPEKATLQERSHALLDSVADLLKAHPEVKKVRVEGHTDSSGKASRNQRLSAARAEGVVKYLVKKGVEKKRLSSKGYGSSQPVADNETPEGKAKNRRVVFAIEKQ
jgi:outer membrane protein OmpA-like peptidoglycan-associated protein